MANKLIKKSKKYAQNSNIINGKLISNKCGKKYLIEPLIKNYHKELINYLKYSYKILLYGLVIKLLIYWHFIVNYRNSVNNFVGMFLIILSNKM
jgi:hypothetical protein